MSLVSLALRLATIRALKGATYAGERVFDSMVSPADLVAIGKQQTIIIVTTDDDDISIQGRDFMAGDHSLELVIEVAAASKLVVEIEGESNEEIITIPASDAGLEASLNFIGWQITKALSASGGEWGDLWRTIVMKVLSVTSRRGADERSGVRYAARQYVFKVDHIAEPQPGTPVREGDAWHRIVQMMLADHEFSSFGKIIEGFVTGNEADQWKAYQMALGLADDETGVFPEKPLVDGAEKLAAVNFGDGFILDEKSADLVNDKEG